MTTLETERKKIEKERKKRDRKDTTNHINKNWFHFGQGGVFRRRIFCLAPGVLWYPPQIGASGG